jgi:K+-transporting ATPase KdpF subunit
MAAAMLYGGCACIALCLLVYLFFALLWAEEF